VGQAAVEHGAVLAALDLLRERTALEVEARLRRGLLDDLFEGQYVDELILRRSLALGFDPRRPARVYAVEAACDDPLTAKLQRLDRAVRACAQASGREHLVAVHGATWWRRSRRALTTPEPGSGISSSAAQPFEDDLRAAFERELPGLAINIGAGTRCNTLAYYRLSHTAARRAVDLMRLVGRADDTLSFRRRRPRADAPAPHRSRRPRRVHRPLRRFPRPL